MDETLRRFLDGRSPSETGAIKAWWDSLSAEARAEVSFVCDERQDGSFFGPIPDDQSGPVPGVVVGWFVPHDDAWGLEDWGPDFFEYMLGHPEQYPIWEPTSRTFHIGCTAHPAARACLAAGRIPADFRCPAGSPGCPIRRLLATASDRSIRLDRASTGRHLIATAIESGPID